VDSIRLLDAPIDLEVDRYWEPVGRPLTPENLDQIEQWVLRRLAESGYPCASVVTQASQVTGEVVLKVDGGKPWVFGEVESEGIPGVLGKTERRFDAFDVGDAYDARLLDLTSQRLISDDLVLNSNFLPDCKSESMGLKQTLLPGQSRLLSFGFGFDTEEYFILRASWLNGRLFENASRLQTEAQGSFRSQMTRVQFDWYYLPFATRHFLTNHASVRRKNERRYETQEMNAGVAPAWQSDWIGAHHRLQSGLGYRYIRTPRGIGRPLTRILSIDSRWNLTSHDFEYYAGSPRSGHELALFHSRSDVAIGSDVSADQYRLTSTHLFNLASLSPPIFVLGFRSDFATTWPGHDTAGDDLPPLFRYHLGGSNNLRGFGRNALPNTDFGALSSGYLGSELRLNRVLPFKVQPLFFTDHGWLGSRGFQLDAKNHYWSPGVGARWESPFGSMRFTLGHGIIQGPVAESEQYLSRWQFYFSFGEPF
jgi:outer membrane translocation and assembly module TamA